RGRARGMCSGSEAYVRGWPTCTAAITESRSRRDSRRARAARSRFRIARRRVPTEAPRVRVLIVDDEPPARKRLRALLANESDVEIAGEAGSGTETDKIISDACPPLVIREL